MKIGSLEIVIIRNRGTTRINKTTANPPDEPRKVFPEKGVVTLPDPDFEPPEQKTK